MGHLESREAELIQFFKDKGLNVVEVNKQEFIDAVHKNTTFEQSSRLDIDQYAAHGGAFPVIVRNVGVVGTVTVSGLPQEEDHRLVVDVLREFLAGQVG